MTLTGMTAFLLISAACAGTAAKPTSKAHEVWYRADGVGTKEASYTLQTEDGGTQQEDINLPLMNKRGETGLTFPGFKSGAFVYLSVQNSTAAGSVTCQIFVDGKEISSNTSTGGFKIASCQGKVP